MTNIISLNSATYRILLSKIVGRDIKGLRAALRLADPGVLDEKDEKGRRLLHHAAISNDQQIITALLDRGALETTVDNDGLTPYMLARKLQKHAALQVLTPPKSATPSTPEPDASDSNTEVNGSKREPKILRVPVTLRRGFPGKRAIA